MILRRDHAKLRTLSAFLVCLALVVAPGMIGVAPAQAAVTVTRVLVDVDFTTATNGGGTITNDAADKTADLTISGSPTGLGSVSGLTFTNTTTANTNQYLTGNLGNTSVMSEIVVEFVAKFPDTGCAAQGSGSMVFSLGSGSIYIPYNIYRHSNFIGFNTFASDIYGITIPDTTGYHSYKFVMLPNSSPQNMQEIWVDGVQQSLAQNTTSVATSPCSRIIGVSENSSGRVFTGGSSSYSDGSFMLMSHPLSANVWGSTGSLKNIRITTSDIYVEPDAPSIGSVTAGDGQLSVVFTAPSSNGGAAVTDYEYSTDNGVTWVSAASTSSPIVITGLTNGTSYDVKLRAINSVGAGAASSSVSGSPVGASGEPTAPLIDDVIAGDGQLSVFFAPPSDDGGAAITDYEYSTDNGVTWTSAASTSSPIVITGLSNGTSYSVMLRAVNGAGDGAASASVSATPSEDGNSPPATLARTGVDVTVAFIGSLIALLVGSVFLTMSRRARSF